ncbi:MAG: hypothetical protein PQJ60_09405, partial [Spirochaetales bacterium]|nr:hypothetical protein [Spirochaetales bacterium]
MSPQLSRWIYGFHGHAFIQHIRGNGYRPMVFMQHGLMVSLWMASGTLVSLSYWLEKTHKKFFGLPMSWVFFGLFFTTICTKSSGASILMVVGVLLYLHYHKKRVTWHIRYTLYLVPIYLVFRMNGQIRTDDILALLSDYF